jgi:hypothetical protein
MSVVLLRLPPRSPFHNPHLPPQPHHISPIPTTIPYPPPSPLPILTLLLSARFSHHPNLSFRQSASSSLHPSTIHGAIAPRLISTLHHSNPQSLLPCLLSTFRRLLPFAFLLRCPLDPPSTTSLRLPFPSTLPPTHLPQPYQNRPYPPYRRRRCPCRSRACRRGQSSSKWGAADGGKMMVMTIDDLMIFPRCFHLHTNLLL